MSIETRAQRAENVDQDMFDLGCNQDYVELVVTVAQNPDNYSFPQFDAHLKYEWNGKEFEREISSIGFESFSEAIQAVLMKKAKS